MTDYYYSTLVVKQKLPGVYVQPSYRSALSKFRSSSFILPYSRHFAPTHTTLLPYSMVWSNIHKTWPLPGWCVQIYSLHPWQLPRWRLPSKCWSNLTTIMKLSFLLWSWRMAFVQFLGLALCTGWWRLGTHCWLACTPYLLSVEDHLVTL